MDDPPFSTDQVPIETVRIIGSSDEDGRRLTAELATFLSPLQRAGMIALRHEGQSVAGDDIDRFWSDELGTRDLVIVLLTPRALADRRVLTCADAVRQRGIPLWPVIVRACAWDYPPFSDLLVLPVKRVPVMQWRDRGRAWSEIAAALRRRRASVQ